MIAFERILAAEQHIRPHAVRTPLVELDAVNQACGNRVFLKLENQQTLGAAKIRGVLNFVANIAPEQLKSGLVAISSGNHAIAVAYAAQLFGVPAYLVLPDISPQFKIDKIKELGGIVTVTKATPAALEEQMRKIQAQTGATFVHYSNSELLVAGLASIGRELIEQMDVQIVLAPVGGGGTLAGIASAIKPAHVIGVEPKGADDLYRSLRSERRELLRLPRIESSIAEGLTCPTQPIPFEIIAQLVDGVVRVSDRAIVEATELLNRAGLKVEPTGAVALAALIESKGKRAFNTYGLNTAIIITGGNTSDDRLENLRSELFGDNLPLSPNMHLPSECSFMVSVSEASEQPFKQELPSFAYDVFGMTVLPPPPISFSSPEEAVKRVKPRFMSERILSQPSKRIAA